MEMPVEMIEEILARLPVKTLLRVKCVCRRWYRVIERRIEMIEEILVRLPVKTLLRFKCVCKHWCDLIESRRFVDRHYYHDSNRERLVFRRFLCDDFNFERELFEEASGDRVDLSMGVEYHHFSDKWLMGPVNGMFCQVRPHGTIDLLTTREMKRLPFLPPLPREREWTDLKFGFGLEPSTGEYKTVAFYGGEFACVYSVSSDCWRFIEPLDPPLVSSLGFMLFQTPWMHMFGGFCNGAYYWIHAGILAFDIRTETFREIEAPGGVERRDICYGGVGVNSGSTALFLSRSFPFSDPWVLGRNDVWVLGNGGCWSKIFSFDMATIPPSIPFRAGSTWFPLCVWKDEMVLLNFPFRDPNVIIRQALRQGPYQATSYCKTSPTSLISSNLVLELSTSQALFPRRSSLPTRAPRGHKPTPSLVTTALKASPVKRQQHCNLKLIKPPKCNFSDKATQMDDAKIKGQP